MDKKKYLTPLLQTYLHIGDVICNSDPADNILDGSGANFWFKDSQS